jgi:hypothetical protein
MHAAVDPSDPIAAFAGSALARWRGLAPWELTARSAAIVADLMQDLDPREHTVADGARIGANAVLAPGVLLPAGAVVRRGAVREQEDPASAR